MIEKPYKIRIEVVASDQQFKEMRAIRSKVFVKEQKIPASKEFDGNDYSCTHLIAYVDKGRHKLPVGTMRMRYFSDFTKFERMAILKNYRKTDISNQIMQTGIDFVSRKGYQSVYGMCKKELLSRWEKNGYKKIDGADIVQQNGMELIPIKLHIDKNNLAINMMSAATMINAIEGKWDNPPQKTEIVDEKSNNTKNKLTAVFFRLKNLVKNR